MRPRSDILQDLVRLAKSLAEIRAELAAYPWDAPEPLVLLEAADVVRTLALFQGGQLSDREIEEWANAIELRDDIAFDSESTKEAIFTLANPVLFGSLTPEVAGELKARLTSHRAPSNTSS